MTSADIVSHALEMLTNGEPSREDLASLYNELRTEFTNRPEQTVSRRALAGVVGEFIDYLEFVERELEPSLGVDRRTERERVLGELSEPRGADSVERVDRLVKQWESIDRYTRDDLHAIFEE